MTARCHCSPQLHANHHTRFTAQSFAVGIAVQAFTSLLAGYETTANALAFTLYCLSANRDKEASLLREIDAFGDSTPSYDDLERFPYVDAVLREGMRLFPPVTFAIREAEQDMVLAGGAVHAP